MAARRRRRWVTLGTFGRARRWSLPIIGARRRPRREREAVMVGPDLALSGWLAL